MCESSSLFSKNLIPCFPINSAVQTFNYITQNENLINKLYRTKAKKVLKMYCTYLTTYKGNKLPPFYIGSSSVENIENGYRGTVKSKKYSKIWKEEIKNNSNLFNTKILSIHKTRKEALEKEKFLQLSLNVIKNSLYINQAIAAPNGFFGMSSKKENHPNYNKKGKEVPWFGLKRSDESKIKYSKSKSGSKNPMAVKYILFDNNNNKILEEISLSEFSEKCLTNNIDEYSLKDLLKTYKTNKPLQKNTTAKRGPKPKFDDKFIGWYVKKEYLSPKQEKQCNVAKDCHWWHNIAEQKESLSKICPGPNWSKGRLKI